MPSTNTGRATIPPIHAWSKMKVNGSFSTFHGQGCTEAETQFRRNEKKHKHPKNPWDVMGVSKTPFFEAPGVSRLEGLVFP